MLLVAQQKVENEEGCEDDEPLVTNPKVDRQRQLCFDYGSRKIHITFKQSKMILETFGAFIFTFFHGICP